MKPTQAASPSKTLRRITSLQHQRRETYLYWQSRSVAERMEAIADIVRDSYALKGVSADSLATTRTLVRLPSPAQQKKLAQD